MTHSDLWKAISGSIELRGRKLDDAEIAEVTGETEPWSQLDELMSSSSTDRFGSKKYLIGSPGIGDRDVYLVVGDWDDTDEDTMPDIRPESVRIDAVYCGYGRGSWGDDPFNRDWLRAAEADMYRLIISQIRSEPSESWKRHIIRTAGYGSDVVLHLTASGWGDEQVERVIRLTADGDVLTIGSSEFEQAQGDSPLAQFAHLLDGVRSDLRSRYLERYRKRRRELMNKYERVWNEAHPELSARADSQEEDEEVWDAHDDRYAYVSQRLDQECDAEESVLEHIVFPYLMREASSIRLELARARLRAAAHAGVGEHIGRGPGKEITMAELARNLYTDRANLSRILTP